MSTRRVHNLVLEQVTALLKNLPELSCVTVVGQNEQDLATLIQTEEGQLDGIVVVVAVNEVRKIHSRPVKYQVSFSADVTEFVPVNRESPGFISAIDAAVECGEAVDSAGMGNFDGLRHTTPGPGVLNAVAECSGEFTVKEV